MVVSPAPLSSNAPTAPTADGKPGGKIEPLLERMETVLRELASLQSMMVNPADPYQMPDELMQQTWQPSVDALTRQFEELARQVRDLSQRRLQRFLWEQALTVGFTVDTGYTIINVMGDVEDDALFEEMLAFLTNSAYLVEQRQSLTYSILMSSLSGTYDNEGKLVPNTTVSPRQRRIRQFLEERLQQEPEPVMLESYLDIYYSLSQENPALISDAQFWQQLESLRGQLAPDAYFRYHLQALNPLDPNADYTSLLRGINTTQMTRQQRRDLLFALSNSISSLFNPEFNGSTPPVQIPEPQRQLLLRYLETNLPAPELQDRFSLYQYGDQLYTIELLRNGQAGAADAFYQKIIGSQSLVEQLAMLLMTPTGNEAVMKRLQQNQPLLQKLEARLQQPGLAPEMYPLLDEGINLLNGSAQYAPEPPDASVDEYGNTTYTQETFAPDDPPETGTTPDTTPADGL